MKGQFGKLLRERRLQKGLTQEQLAELAKVSVRTISRLENDKPVDARIGTVAPLADALGLTPDERRQLLAQYGQAPPAEAPADATPPPPAGRGALDETADHLAGVVRARWRREAEHQGIGASAVLPVRWRPAPAAVTDRWENIQRVAAGATVQPVDLSRAADDISTVYRRIRSGRLVVLGRAGSGKTVLTLRFVLDHQRGPGEPVPVIFGIGSWDPRASGLRDWLIDQLRQDHPFLAATTPAGVTLAAALVDDDRVLPVLDGFDEIAPGLRGAALAELNVTTLPLLLTSRAAEYREAVAAAHAPLTAAAGIELTDLTPADVADYLPRTTHRTSTGVGADAATSVWDPVLIELRDHPDSAGATHLAAVLSTPLMVLLARTTYGGVPDRDPADLLDTARFPTAEAIEDHLLASFVPALYRPRAPHPPRRRSGYDRPRRPRSWDPRRVQHWLGYLAHHLDHRGTPDLAWWHLAHALRRSTRILTVTLVAALAISVSDWVVNLPAYLAAGGLGLRAGLLDVALIGPVVGLGFGLVYGLLVVGGVRFEPSRVQLRLWGGRVRSRRAQLRAFTDRFGRASLGGFVVGLGYGPAMILERELLWRSLPISRGEAIRVALLNGSAFGLIFGLAAGIVFGLLAALESPLDTDSAASPAGLLRTNRATVARHVLVVAPTVALLIGFGGRLVVTALQPFVAGPLLWPYSSGLLIGAVGGLGGALAYGLAFTAWGQWLILSRIWLPVTGRLPGPVVTFLDDAYERGVFRQVGAVYQFRHARLQDHLSRGFAAHCVDCTTYLASSAPETPGGSGNTSADQRTARHGRQLG